MKTFLISDTHFCHANILTFTDKNNNKIRPEFKDVKDMDLTMIYNWNSIVSPEDKVYHLGDIAMTSFTHLKNIFDVLNGTKILIKGNHDNLKLSQYQQLFKDIRAYHVLDNFILSHIPIHPDSLYRWKANIHGHLHKNKIENKKYINVCVENINYTPIDFEKIKNELYS